MPVKCVVSFYLYLFLDSSLKYGSRAIIITAQNSSKNKKTQYHVFDKRKYELFHNLCVDLDHVLILPTVFIHTTVKPMDWQSYLNENSLECFSSCPIYQHLCLSSSPETVIRNEAHFLQWQVCLYYNQVPSSNINTLWILTHYSNTVSNWNVLKP